MSENGIYEAIAKRTGGDIYVGVVGPVRTGKSTFIHRFMESVVLPNIQNEYDKERTIDEIPQSGSGKTITTTEPKFVPGEAVGIKLGESEIRVRMIDCVGYMVDGAAGAEENGEWRMVVTPWSSEPLPFARAAEIGTEKVTREHSTIAMLVTTDGSFTDIPRENYIPAEERAARELLEAKKPFAIILNTAYPESEEAHCLAAELEEKYNAPVAVVDCTKLNAKDATGIIELVIGEFPVKELCFHLPVWCTLLPEDHKIRTEIMEKISDFCEKITKFSQIKVELGDDMNIISLDASSGKGDIDIPIPSELYYATLSEMTGLSLDGEASLFSALSEMSKIKKDYDKIKDALTDARECGYGIVMPARSELTLSEPIPVKQSSGYGIKVGAVAECIHMIKTYIRTDVCPPFGTEEQTNEVVRQMREEYDENPSALLDTKMFGRTLSELVKDGMNAKLMHLPDDARAKMGQTIEKIINEGASGLICILL